MKTITPKIMRYAPTFSVRTANEESRVLTFSIATESVALDNGVLISEGMDAVRYLENPIVLADHNYTKKIGRTIALRNTGDAWEADVEFPPREVSEEADDAYRFLRWSGFGAASVGFVVTKMNREPSPELVRKYKLPERGGWIGEKWQLLEWSIVGVGSDPLAIMHAGGAEARAFRSAMAKANLAHWRTFTTNEGQRMDDETADSQETTESGGDGMAMLGEKIDALTSAVSVLAKKLDQAIGSKEAEPVEEPRSAFDWSAILDRVTI